MIRLILVLALLLTLAAPRAEAQACLDVDLDEAAARAGELTTLLQVANFRGDVVYMGEIALELEQFLDTCGDEASGRLALVCDYQCHLQLGRYRLFLAAELPFLATASGVSRNDSPLSPQAAQATGQNGIEIVDRGLRILARQQGRSDGDGDGDGDGDEAAYRTFVRQLVALNALKIRLYMNTGDIWYQTLSEARLAALDFLIVDTLGAASDAGLESQPNLAKAHTNYEAAMWTLLETALDVPGESTYDDLRADLSILQSDLRARLDSVRRGHLFLGIDPMAFSTIPFDELRAELESTKAELDRVDAQVEAIIERWQANKFGEATRQLDEERTIRSQRVNLIAHQIGKLEGAAREFATDVEEEINQVAADLDPFSFRQSIRQLEFELATRIAEFENQSRQIQQRQELDLLVLSKEAEIERRNELRWLLNWEMTQMNLDLQISSLQSQITEYDRQTARNQTDLQQIERQKGILETRQANAQLGIAAAEARIAEIEERRTVLFRQGRLVAREQLCAIEEQLALIGASVDAPFSPVEPGETACPLPAPAFTQQQYQAAMCGDGTDEGLRAQLFGEQIEARAFLVQCVIGDADFDEIDEIAEVADLIDPDMDLEAEMAGVECGAFSTTETDFASRIYAAEKEVIELRAENLTDLAEDLSSRITEVVAWAAAFDGTVIAAQTGLTIAETALATADLMPTQTVAAAGLASGIYTTIDLSASAANTVNALRTVLETVIATGRVTQATLAQVDALGRQLDQARQANAQLDKSKIVKALALSRSHYEIAGRRATGIQQLRELTLQSSIAALDCDQGALGIETQIARLNAEHRRIVSQMDLRASENDLLQFQTAAQEREIERLDNELAALALELETLGLSRQQLIDDTARIASLVGDAHARIERLAHTKGVVTGLAEESQAATNVINELRDRQEAQMLALSEAELGFVAARIASEQSNSEVLTANLEEAIALGLKNVELRERIRQFNTETQEQVAERQDELMSLVSEIDDPAERRTLFIANQETLSELLKGIPEYIVTKRRSFETANRLLHLMRQRHALVQGILGGDASAPDIYVRNATQLGALVDAIVQNRFFDERQINIDVARIFVPETSGFVRELALEGDVTFEITPFADTETAMRQNGHYTLWSPTKFADRRNLILIDAFMGAQYQCTGTQFNRFTLEHGGSGYVFRALAEGSDEVAADILIGPERRKIQTFFDLTANPDVPERVISFWLNGIFQARRFPPPSGPENDPAAVLPFLGAPVMGTYSVSLQPADCPFHGAVVTVFIIFASEP